MNHGIFYKTNGGCVFGGATENACKCFCFGGVCLFACLLIFTKKPKRVNALGCRRCCPFWDKLLINLALSFVHHLPQQFCQKRSHNWRGKYINSSQKQSSSVLLCHGNHTFPPATVFNNSSCLYHPQLECKVCVCLWCVCGWFVIYASHIYICFRQIYLLLLKTCQCACIFKSN